MTQQNHELGKYTVVQTGMGVREFDKGADALKHLVKHEGEARLYAPDGNLLMTKGEPPGA